MVDQSGGPGPGPITSFADLPEDLQREYTDAVVKACEAVWATMLEQLRQLSAKGYPAAVQLWLVGRTAGVCAHNLGRNIGAQQAVSAILREMAEFDENPPAQVNLANGKQTVISPPGRA